VKRQKTLKESASRGFDRLHREVWLSQLLIAASRESIRTAPATLPWSRGISVELCRNEQWFMTCTSKGESNGRPAHRLDSSDAA
jgi:hypothetical protein